MLLAFGLSVSSLAQAAECLDWAMKSRPIPIDTNLQSIRASADEISALTGISVSELEWATATDPLFTLIVEDQVIPYHSFGPEFDTNVTTSSGLFVQAQPDSLLLTGSDGHTQHFELQTLLAEEADSFENAGTEWLWVIPVVGTTSCAALTELCQQRCSTRVAECGDCGGWCDCDWCGRGSSGCFTCPSLPPDTGSLQL